jgi:hypothetical protein
MSAVNSTIYVSRIPSYLKKAEHTCDGKLTMGNCLGDTCYEKAIQEKGQ